MNNDSKKIDLNQIIKQLPCHVYWVDKDGVTLGCNDQVIQFLKQKGINEVVGKSHQELYSKPLADKLDALVRKVVETGEPILVEEIVEDPQLGDRVFLSYKSPLLNLNKEIVGLIGISVDITNQKEKVNELEHILSIIPGHIWWTDLDGRTKGCNLRMANNFGFDTTACALDKTTFETFPTTSNLDERLKIASLIDENDKKVIDTGEDFSGIERVIINDEERVFYSTKSLFKDPFGKKLGIIGVAQDITAEQTQMSILKDIVFNIPGHIWWTDLKGDLLGCNLNMAQNYGFNSVDEILGASAYELLPKDMDESLKAQLVKEHEIVDDKVIKTGKTFIGEEEFISQGKPRIFLSEKRPVKDLDGNITGIVGIAQDITDLKQAQAAAEKANKVKSEFIANMSHDLRTPITGMLGEAEFIENSAESADIRESGRFLRQATNQLLRLTNDILEFVNLEADNVEDQEIVFDPIEVINNVMTLMQVSIKQKQLSSEVLIDPNVPKAVRGYGLFYERIINNLIGNAIKFTAKGGIKLYLQLDSEHADEATLRLVVEDTGMGIPSNEFNNIFDKFTRLSSSYQGLYEGSGLGLYSVREYIGKMQGDINVESIVNKGTKFTVLFPFKKAVAAETVPITISRSKIPVMKDEESVENTLCEIKPINMGKTRIPKILVVEDSALPARALLRLLEEHRCEITIAKTGEDAVKEVLKRRYDLILMDIGLPGIDGVEAARQIRALPKHSNAPIVAVTGHIRKEKKDACVEVGMQDVYSKPLTRHQLKTIINDYIINQSKPGGIAMDTAFPKNVLNIDAMMTQFLTDEPKQLLDMLEVARDYIPLELEKFNRAIDAKDTATLKAILHSLKGGVAYISAPDSSAVIAKWDENVREGQVKDDDFSVMKTEMNETIAELNNAIKEIITKINES